MSLTLRWVKEDEFDRVAETRWMAYGNAGSELARFKEGIRTDQRAGPGDYLLAETNGQAVGTTTSMSLTMWVRGAAISCQGVAYVGAIKSARRRGGGADAKSAGNPGVASAIMAESLRIARERQHVISALMPFRASFYEHFGYGLMERQARWTLPLCTLPSGDCEGWRLIQPGDYADLAAAWQSRVEAGQCDIERSSGRWESRRIAEQEGMVFIDRPAASVPIRASALMTKQMILDKSVLHVNEWTADSAASFKGLLCFLSTLRDQYSSAIISVPADWPLNRWLREPQLPHRLVEHAVAEARMITPLQMRILDHGRFLQSLRLTAEAKGRCQIAIQETEGHLSHFGLDIAEGRAFVKAGQGNPDFEILDRHWAAIACGDLSATQALCCGLARENTPGTAKLLDCLAVGPAPFCQEYF
ncbi:MAG: GNAT family N-acetyltransferase [Planctomycetota bacterium]|nr:GNAT family N-acetyltransferase [Planctomycetota bacterium]